jgi:hypothetical protein
MVIVTRHCISLEWAACSCGMWATRADGTMADHQRPNGRPCTEPRAATAILCGHVPGAPWMTVPSRPVYGAVPMACPCCGMRGWAGPDGELDRPWKLRCLYCDEWAVQVGEGAS